MEKCAFRGPFRTASQRDRNFEAAERERIAEHAHCLLPLGATFGIAVEIVALIRIDGSVRRRRQ